MINFLKSDIKYKEMINNYTRVDAIIAIFYYIFFMITYYAMGVVYNERKLYLGIQVNIILVILCIILVLIRKQKLNSVGITLYKLKKSLLLGFILGICFMIISNIIPNIMSKNHLHPLQEISYNIFYYFIVIAFVEEVIFRGYLQTRIYGLIKSDTIAIIITGLMFALMHIPFQMGAANMNLPQFLLSNYVWLILLVVWHFVFNFLYRKYNSLWSGTILHGFMDLGNSLFM